MRSDTGLAPLAFPRNPRYGSGVARRHIELVGDSGRVSGYLVDPFHEMRCEVEHDGRLITDIRGAMPRHPTTACPGAIVVLRELVGAPLPIPMQRLYASGVMVRHCTHLYDLAGLCIAHAARGRVNRTYDAVVPDAHDVEMTVAVRRNSVTVHEWRVRDSIVTGPAPLAGLPLLRGFWAEASRRMSGDDLEAALVLARTYLISLGRPYDAEAWAGRSLDHNPALLGRCHAYSATHAKSNTFLPDYVREEWAEPNAD